MKIQIFFLFVSFFRSGGWGRIRVSDFFYKESKSKKNFQGAGEGGWGKSK